LVIFLFPRTNLGIKEAYTDVSQELNAMYSSLNRFFCCLVLLCCLPGCNPASTPNAKLTSPDDLKDKRIAVLQGSTHESYATGQYPKATVLQYKSVSDMLLAVKSGKADAAIYSRHLQPQ
jgi:polar amino acid transport system substrate-binding protein